MLLSVLLTGFPVGSRGGSIENCYFDKNTTGQNDGVGNGLSTGVTDVDTADMKQKSTFTNWDFTAVWLIDEGNDYPRLLWELFTGGAGTMSSPYMIETPEQLNAVRSNMYACRHKEGKSDDHRDNMERQDGEM